MIDYFVAWLLAHPLQGVAVLAGVSIATGLFLVPRGTSLSRNNHPPC